MKRHCFFIFAALVAFCGCEGPAGLDGAKGDRGDPGQQGEQGEPGTPGASGTSEPSISAVTPSSGYLGRTLDLVVSGTGTMWASDTKVSLSDPKITVNSVTAGSETGLLVNVTIPPDAAEGAVDVIVTDMVGAETYKGAFKVASPIEVTVEPATGVPQGGIANLRVRMLDTTTPFDEQALKVMFGSADVGLVEISNVSPFGMDVLVQSDVLAATAGVDLTVMSGEGSKTMTSPRSGAFQVAARMPTALQSDMVVQADLKDATASELYSYTPADANAHFIQMTLGAIDGYPTGWVVPKSGKLSEALGMFDARFAAVTQATDPLYLLVRRGALDSGDPYAAGLLIRDYTGTAMTETIGNVDPSTANTIAALPAIVTGDLIMGMNQSDDWFKFDVTGASAGTPKKIHLATAGDAQSDVIAEVFDTDGFTPLGYTIPDANHKDLELPDIMIDGTYYVRVVPGFQFNAAHSAYKLLVEVQ